MSAARRLMREVLDAELTRWPGVEHTLVCGTRGAHPRLVLSYQGRSRFVVMPGSPSDRRVGLNVRADVRRELATLGARRAE